MKQNATKAPMIKSAAYNKVQRFFQTKQVYNRQTYKWETAALDPLAALKPEEKFKLIEEIMNASIEEMKNYKKSRKKSKAVHENRLETGYYEKKAAKNLTHKSRIGEHQDRVKELQSKLGHLPNFRLGGRDGQCIWIAVLIIHVRIGAEPLKTIKS